MSGLTFRRLCAASLRFSTQVSLARTETWSRSAVKKLNDIHPKRQVRLLSSLVKAPNDDILLNQLNKAKGLRQILDVIAMHHPVMNNQHIVAAFTIIQRYSDTMPAEDLMSNPTFESLCNQAILRARYFNLYDVIAMLKQLTLLPLSPSSRLVQSYLQMLKSNINDVPIHNIPFLSFLFHKFQQRESTALVEALRMALPMVMQLNINQQLEELSPKSLVACLSFSVYNNMNEDIHEKLICHILKKKRYIQDYSDAFRVFNVLGLLKINDSKFDELFEAMIEILTSNIKKLPVSHTLSAMTTCEQRYIIHDKFFEAVAKRMIQEQWNLWQISGVLSVFISLKFINVECLEIISEMILKDQDTVRDDPRVSIFNFVEIFSMANCLPTNAEKVFDVLCSCEKKIHELTNNSPFMLLTMVSNLVSLQYQPKSLIQVVTNPLFLAEVLKESLKPARSKIVYEMLLLINQSLSNRNSDEESYLPKEFIHQAIVHCSKYMKPRGDLDNLFASALEQGLGGSQYVLSNLWTKNGNFIDHLIVMRGGKYPMAINFPSQINDEADDEDKVRFIEDLPLPMDVKLVAVLPINSYNYACNLPRIRSTIAFNFMDLEKYGLAVTAVHLDQWAKLMEAEKIPYLMREIHEAVPNLNAISSSNFRLNS